MNNESVGIKLAVLIDAENAPAAIIESLLAEIASLGEAVVKRIYGDFTSPLSSQWKLTLNKYAIKPMQQFAYTKGKNATDSALIIDAMDLLHSNLFGGFCLVSSDSDFTCLAMRIREAGLKVYGFGEQKTPEAFRNACHRFTYVEVLRQQDMVTSGRVSEEDKAVCNPAVVKAKKKDGKRNAVASNTTPLIPLLPHTAVDEKTGGTEKTEKAEFKGSQAKTTLVPDAKEELPLELLKDAIKRSLDDSGWATLSAVGTYLNNIKPDFDPRLYGAHNAKLNTLFKEHPEYFTLEEIASCYRVCLKTEV
ncbi:MAG: NYN domain-containing protein [Lentisphaeria bacterium]|nr:NYN domain-containing protein [Lentisphaeria bacterium]